MSVLGYVHASLQFMSLHWSLIHNSSLSTSHQFQIHISLRSMLSLVYIGPWSMSATSPHQSPDHISSLFMSVPSLHQSPVHVSTLSQSLVHVSLRSNQSLFTSVPGLSSWFMSVFGVPTTSVWSTSVHVSPHPTSVLSTLVPGPCQFLVHVSHQSTLVLSSH